jgi:sugar transferase (PEP-CTERM/EpsH1 system associated)
MSKLHVLMLTPYLPYPPVSGGRMRTYNLVKHLHEDHDVTLVCFGRPEEQALDWSPMAALCDMHVVPRDESPGTIRAALMSITSGEPITMRLYRNEAMRRTLAQIIAATPPDVIHVESFYMLQNLPRDTNIPVLLSEPAIEYKAWGQYAKVAKPFYTRPGVAIEAMKMRQVEPRVWAQADLVGVMSDVDAAIMREVVPGVKTWLTPNGVDVDFFHMDASVARDSKTAVFMGDYKYFPNTDAVTYFAAAIMPLIRAKRPDFHLTLLGKDPSPEIRALHGDGVTVTGLVDDTRPYLQSSAVFVCPIRSGSGTRFKLMESLACGCPVVSTTVGCEGLGAVDGEHMLIRDDPQGFADAVVSLLDDLARGAAMGAAGREWVVQNHAWSRSAALVRDAYRALMKRD